MVYTIIQKLLSLGLSQTEISKRADVPQSRISDIATGKQSTIAYESGKRLEALLEEIVLEGEAEKRRVSDRRANRRNPVVK